MMGSTAPIVGWRSRCTASSSGYEQGHRRSVAARAKSSRSKRRQSTAGPPPPPRISETGSFNWIGALEEDADEDDEVRDLLKGTDGDADAIRRKMRQKMELESGSELFSFSKGSPHPMRVTFREVHPFNLWLWFELYSEPAREDKEALKELLRSWFVVGKFGGYNSMNLQAFHKTEFDASWMDYNVKDSDTALEAYLHSLHDMETKGHWARARLDMGSADELAFDILINMLQGFNSSVLGIRTLYIGGQNSDWPVPDVNEVPETDIDPMRVNPVAEEDLDDFLDDGTLPAGSFPRDRADSLEGMDDKQRAKLDSLVERLNLSGFTVDSSDPRGGSSSSSSRGKPPLA